MESVTESTRFTAATWDRMRAVRLANNVGLRITLLENGLIGSIEHRDILINPVRGVPPEGAPFRLWARAEMRANLVSGWTVALAYQTFGQLAELFRRIGEDHAAGELNSLRERIYEDFHRHFMPGGIVAGFGIRRNGRFTPLVHPHDEASGLRFRLLPMTRGIISGIFTLEEARRHRALIREHLQFPDGVRLMDKPVRYTGGTMKLFQRAEVAAYFDREVSRQYVHAHLRYAEAAAVLGDAGELWWALSVVNPIHLPHRVL